MSHRATIYRLYPSSNQEALLLDWMNQCRFIWNKSLEETKNRYETEKKFNFEYAMKMRIPVFKKQFQWLTAPAHALQNKCTNLSNSIKRFIKARKEGNNEIGFPDFKSKRNYTAGIEIDQVNNHIQLFDKFIKIPKMGLVKYRKHREELGILKSITIKKKANKWFVVCLFKTEEIINAITNINTADIGGIDVGLKEFLTDDRGNKIDNPRFLKKSLKKLAKAQRQFAKTQKKSKNREKKKLRVAVIHMKITNCRKDFHHKVANAIAKQKLIIISEDLNIKGMVKNHKLARAISDVSWSNFLNLLSYKLQAKGGWLERIGRFFPSTKTCSCCGVIKNMKLSERTYSCDSCGSVMDRDHNAAINIINEGINQINRAGTARIYACEDTEISHHAVTAWCDIVSLKQEAPIPLGSE